MDQRKKEKILLGVDLLFLVVFFGSLIGFVVKKYMIEDYPFLLVYIYLVYLALYLTFRLKHCKSMPLPVLYRLHLFNFLFSVFSLITGYIEVIRSIKNEGIL